jgi:hypothetical protein
MRRTGSAWAVILIALALAACGGEDEEEPAASSGGLTLELAAQNGSGQSGTATLAPAGDGETSITVELSNPPAEPQPSHVHSGSCDDIGGVVAPLDSVVMGQAETVVPMSLEELRRGDLIVHAHKSEAESDVSVACSEIPKAADSVDYGY